MKLDIFSKSDIRCEKNMTSVKGTLNESGVNRLILPLAVSTGHKIELLS